MREWTFNSLMTDDETYVVCGYMAAEQVIVDGLAKEKGLM
jgi:hypothetical protein